MLVIAIIFVVFGAIASTVIGLFVLSRNPRHLINQVYAIMTLAFIAIVVANSMTTGNGSQVLTFIRIVIAATSVAMAAIYFLATLIRDSNARLRHNPKYQIAIIATLVVVLLDLSPVVFSGSTIQGAQAIPTPGPGVAIFAVHFLFFLITSIIVLATGIPKARGLKRSQYLSIVIGLAPVLLFAPITSFVLPVLLQHAEYIFLTPLYATFFVGAVAYSMVRHRLFDIKRAAVRTFNYALTLMTLGFIYYAIAYLISNIILRSPAGLDSSTASLINITLALLLAFIFQPIKRFFDKVTNFVFYRDTYNENEFFARLTHTLSTMTDLSTLLHYASTEISKTLKASFGAFLVYRTDKRPLYASTIRGKTIPQQDTEALDTYIGTHASNVLVTAELSNEDEHSRAIRRLLIGHHIAIVLPIKQDNLILGYFFLGEHLSSEYTQTDVDALQTVASELVIAMENALSIQAVRELNATLQQRVDNATRELRASNAQLQRLDKAKDDFISMASHQLRTPLTSVKGYISMVREGDAGKITKSQDELLGEAFTSSERMVHLISDFLNVSRLQTGKFQVDKRPVDLAKIIEQELDSLATNAKSRNLSFSYKQPKNFPTLNLDEDKMRQVIMNFSDNAIYYSAEGTKITVKLAVEGKDAVFTVVDTGIGVPRAEQSQLFNKFYRASNARKQRPDGTGVGLYLAKTVIEAHGGKVVFQSVEGKGSTFGFRLPLQDLRPASDTDNLDNNNNKG